MHRSHSPHMMCACVHLNHRWIRLCVRTHCSCDRVKYSALVWVMFSFLLLAKARLARVVFFGPLPCFSSNQPTTAGLLYTNTIQYIYQTTRHAIYDPTRAPHFSYRATTIALTTQPALKYQTRMILRSSHMFGMHSTMGATGKNGKTIRQN